MKLLYVTWQFPKLSESFVSGEVKMLLNRGHDVRVYTFQPGDPLGDPTPATVHQGTRSVLRHPARAVRMATRVPRRRITEQPKFEAATIAAAAAVTAELRDWRPDIVHAHFLHQSATIALRVAEILKVPCTLTAHAGDWTVAVPPAEVNRKLHLADHTFVISEQALDELRRRSGVPADRLSLIRAFHDMKIATTRHRPSQHRVVCVARLVPKKGLDTLIEALAIARADCPDISLTIVGDGPLRDDLSAQVASLGLGASVRFTGPLDQLSAQREIACADVFALPCRVLGNGDADGIPVAMMEAIALHVPVISTPVAGVPELITSEREGCLVPPDSPEALAHALAAVLGDPAGARAKADAALERLEVEFAPELQMERLEGRWQSLV